MKEVTCNTCGKVHMSLSLDEINVYVNDFNNKYDRLTKVQRENIYGNKRASMNNYNKCTNCGNDFINFRDAKDEDAPIGCTIKAILDRDELL